MAKKIFKETKVGGWINKNYPAVLHTILGVAGTVFPAASGITSMVDKLVPDMPQEHKEELAGLLTEYEAVDYKDYLADVQDARAREVAINNSENATWLVKNIVPMIAIAVILFTVTLDILVLIREIKTTENITFLIIGNANSLSTLVLGYYFGSSRSSTQKDETIRKLSNQ